MSTHAGIAFAVEHPELASAWEQASNSLVVLSVPDEDDLLCWADWVYYHHIPYSLFREPDIGNEHVALALMPDQHEAYRLRKLPLALRNPSDPRWQRESAIRRSLHSAEGGEHQ